MSFLNFQQRVARFAVQTLSSIRHLGRLRPTGMNWKADFDANRARDLLRRRGVGHSTIDAINDQHSLQIALEVAGELTADMAPDKTWWKDYLELSTDHFILTEYGWVPAELNDVKHTGEEPMEVLAQINAP